MVYSTLYSTVYSTVYSIVFSNNVLETGWKVFLRDKDTSASHCIACEEYSVRCSLYYSVDLVYSIVYSTVYSLVLDIINRRQGVECSSRNKSARPATLTSGYSLLYRNSTVVNPLPPFLLYILHKTLNGTKKAFSLNRPHWANSELLCPSVCLFVC